MVVIGAVGLNGSGKDTVIQYIAKKHNLKIISIGDIARDIAKAEGLPLTRESLNEVSKRYFKERGVDFFVRTAIETIKRNKWADVAITGIRTPTDVQVLKKAFGDNFVLIHVETPSKARFERLVKRGEARDPLRWEDFLEQDKREEGAFRISETCASADYRIENGGTIEQLGSSVDELMGMLMKKRDKTV